MRGCIGSAADATAGRAIIAASPSAIILLFMRFPRKIHCNCDVCRDYGCIAADGLLRCTPIDTTIYGCIVPSGSLRLAECAEIL
jgi:hypothetical protein